MKAQHRSAMISPVGRSPVCHMNGTLNGNRPPENGTIAKNGKDKVGISKKLTSKF